MVGELVSESTAPVVAVVSPKGGNGKTTVSTSLAVAMGRRQRTFLIDLDVLFGDVEYALRLHPIHRLDDLIGLLRDNPKSDLTSFLTPHSSGVDVLCAPGDPFVADRIQSKDALEVIDRLIEVDHPTVLDTAGGVDDYTLGALDRASHIVLVSGTDVSSVQAGRKLIDVMEFLKMPLDRVHLVVNRSNARAGLTVDDVEAVLGMSAEWEIPESRDVAAAANQGSPITESMPHTPIARGCFELADRLLGHDPSTTRRRFAFGGRS